MQRVIKTVAYLRVALVAFTAFTFSYGIKTIYGSSQAIDAVVLGALLTSIAAGLLFIWYGSLTLREELRLRCGCTLSCCCKS